MLEILDSAWRQDSLATLKIIFNARSIHLGKASRQTFYRCAGWLAKNYPRTLIANLVWLSHPVIQKKVDKKVDADDLVFFQEETIENEPARFDVKNGVAHGYWKDLLNLLVLHVNDKLDVLANPRDILNIEKETGRKNWPKDQEEAKTLHREKRDARNESVIERFNDDPVYCGLHLAVSRLFAAQLKTDLARLKSDDTSAKRQISLCAKWAPSLQRFHDKHTFLASSIAEILHPLSEFNGFEEHDPNDIEQRTFYLRHAREAYRKDIAALRKHLECVERDITAGTYKNIQYERVPSLAMNNHAPLFARRDTDRFEKYIDQVASGKARISGATLLPSTMIKAVDWARHNNTASVEMVSGKRKLKGIKEIIEAKINEMTSKARDGQWKTLVQRIKDSGTLDNCIAVADVSGSMRSPSFHDGTCPMHSSVGLALLIAEVCKPPFGGAFITFSTIPEVQKIDLSMTLREKYDQLSQSQWSMTTDFVAVFEQLILPMAVENKLKQEDMVKRVFVFSDMQFDKASGAWNQFRHWTSETDFEDNWSSSYARIEKKFEQAGYEMPELVFWNLAGGRAGYKGSLKSVGDPIAPKPVTASDEGTALVSGYSQGMLKVFLDSGTFEDEEAKEEIIETTGNNGEVIIEKVKKQKMDPMTVVKKAIGHKAYGMLRVVD